MSHTSVNLVKVLACVVTTAITFVGAVWAVDLGDGAIDANWWMLVALGLLPVVGFALAVTEPMVVRIAGLGMAGATAAGWMLCYTARGDAMAGLSVMMGYAGAVTFVIYGVAASRASVAPRP